jgi:predicted SprT family Zn-dependent metalloprotease
MTLIVSEAAKILKEVTPLIEAKYGCKIPKIEIIASGHMKTTFGRAELKHGQYSIKLSKYAYEGNTQTRAFRNTTIHEIAHIVEHLVYKQFSHSHQWESIMAHLNEKAARFVTQEKKAEIEYVRPPKRKMTKYVHKCGAGCKHTLSGQKHNKLMRGMTYTCRKTGARLLSTFETVKV